MKRYEVLNVAVRLIHALRLPTSWATIWATWGTQISSAWVLESSRRP
jgi:hypothetical protein